MWKGVGWERREVGKGVKNNNNNNNRISIPPSVVTSELGGEGKMEGLKDNGWRAEEGRVEG